MSPAVSVLLAATGLVPLLLALGPASDPYVLVTGEPTRLRPRTALQVAACLFQANVPWHTAQVAVDRVQAGAVDLPVLVEWLETFGETATVFALVAGMDTHDLRAVLSGRERVDVDSLRLLAGRKNEL